MENEEKRMISSYEVTQSIHIGKKEVVFGIDEKEEYPYLVCYCTYDNPLSAEWVTDAVGSDDYLEAMQMFTDRVRSSSSMPRSTATNTDILPTSLYWRTAVTVRWAAGGRRCSALPLRTESTPDGNGATCLGKSSQRRCPNGQKKHSQKSNRRKRRRNQRAGRNADGGTGFDAI